MLVYDSIRGCCGCTASQAHLFVRQVQGRRIGTYCTRCTASEYPCLAIKASIALATLLCVLDGVYFAPSHYSTRRAVLEKPRRLGR